MQVEMAGMPMKMPDIKDTRCVTPEMLKNPSSAVPSASPDKNNDCQVSDYKATGNNATWKIILYRPDPAHRRRRNHLRRRHLQGIRST